MTETEQPEQQPTEELKLNDGTETPLNLNPAEMNPESEAGVFGSEIYTEAEFIEGFRGVFNAGGDITGIKSLKINMDDTRDRVGSERAAVRLYEACGKYNFLHFLIDKRSGWFADLVIIGTFTIAKGRAVADEVGYTPKIGFLNKVKLWLKSKKEQPAAA